MTRGEPAGPVRRGRGRGARRGIAAGAAVVVAAVVAGGLVAASGLGDSGGEAREEAAGREADGAGWERAHFLQRMRLAFTGIAADIPELSRRADEIEAGTRPASDIAADLGASRRRAEGTRDLVAASAGLAGDARPKGLFLRSALLYIEAVRALRIAVTAMEAEEPVSGDVVDRARRLKILSDRVFDRASAAADPALGAGGERFTLPDPVPDWAAEGLAAPPMPPAAGSPAAAEAAGERPARPPDGWVSDMAPVAAGVADAAGRFPALAATPDSGTARAAAARLAGAARSARAVPAPAGGAEAFDVLRLAVLIDLEAALAFDLQARSVPPAAEDAARLARHLAVLGEDLWRLAAVRLPRGLAAHPRSGFDRTGFAAVPVPGLTGGR